MNILGLASIKIMGWFTYGFDISAYDQIVVPECYASDQSIANKYFCLGSEHSSLASKLGS